MQSSIDDCARSVLEVTPLVTREIRRELRRFGPKDLSMPQFRTLLFLDSHKGPSISEVAEHVGLKLASTSVMVDALVKRRLAKRETRLDDRRCVTLTLTAFGEATLRSARKATIAYLTEQFKRLTESDLTNIVRSMQTLRSIFQK